MVIKYCKGCRLRIENTLSRCPLCGAFTDERQENIHQVNDDYPVIHSSFVTEMIQHLMLFGAIAVSLVSMFLNFVVVKQGIWSIIIVLCAFYLYSSTLYLLKKRRHLGVFSVMQVGLLSVVVVLIDVFTGWRGWSIDYVMPALIVSGSLTLVIMSICRPFRWKEYMFYVLVIALFGLVPALSLIFGWTSVPIISGICVLDSVLTVLAMVVFSRRKLRTELRRRLHF